MSVPPFFVLTLLCGSLFLCTENFLTVTAVQGAMAMGFSTAPFPLPYIQYFKL